jgi:hypothetical protein
MWDSSGSVTLNCFILKCHKRLGHNSLTLSPRFSTTRQIRGLSGSLQPSFEFMSICLVFSTSTLNSSAHLCEVGNGSIISHIMTLGMGRSATILLSNTIDSQLLSAREANNKSASAENAFIIKACLYADMHPFITGKFLVIFSLWDR